MSDHPKTVAPAWISNARLLYTMVRVRDLDRSIAFYTGPLGMTLFRKESYPEGRFTLAFVGYGTEQSQSTIELTHNWDVSEYQMGTGYGHIGIAVAHAEQACAQLASAGVKVVRPAGPMKFESPERDHTEVIAFIEDPDGYRLELLEVQRSQGLHTRR